MTASARQNILARLRQSPVVSLPEPSLDAWTRQLSQADYLHSLETQLSTAHAEVIHAHPEGWRRTVEEVCNRYQIRSLMLPNLPDLLTSWEGGPDLIRFDQPMEALKATLFDRIDAGLTLAECAIADTGTLVILSSPEQPRSLSLVPPIHICLLDATRLYPDMPTALKQEQWSAAMPTNLIFVSGPSKTADIQQTLAYGAHGPKALVVILVHGEIQ
ncbi:lactate utilization protein C [Azovibrio restrictus]|uniref:LutC/YkgG family protein n=1 Tax=Azovibrio restrictus TaxID=146938 RepID=UPI0026E9C84E|nr:lactate utilization protein C [Azovibrio restrictus]